LTSETGWGIESPDGYPPNLGRLVKTSDGGATWGHPDQAPDVHSVCFAGDKLGWAAGPHEAGAALFRTEDGGATWTETPVPIPGGDLGWIATVRCAGVDAWMLASADGGAGHIAYVVFRTNEGGPDVTPVLQEAVTHPMGQGQGIAEALNPKPGPLAAFDALRGGVVTSCPACGGGSASVSYEQTYDGGGTWYPSTVFGSNPPADPVGASFLSPDHGWVLVSVQRPTGLEAQVLVTNDGGATWAAP
jgi:hypothetical protein